MPGYDVTEAVGLLAGLLTTVAFVPQVVRTRALGSARDFSLKMLLLFVAGIVMWLAYGVLSRSMPVILANAATLLLASYILAVKLRRG
ncbi:MAG: SemiSWEET transporter [Gemmatimonadaceae bacterium]|nr:SemiSWEET transporter [Acetobacteraceae bacterium]